MEYEDIKLDPHILALSDEEFSTFFLGCCEVLFAEINQLRAQVEARTRGANRDDTRA